MRSHVDSDAALRRIASAVVLGVATALIVIKLWGWMATGSVALLVEANRAASIAGVGMGTTQLPDGRSEYLARELFLHETLRGSVSPAAVSGVLDHLPRASLGMDAIRHRFR